MVWTSFGSDDAACPKFPPVRSPLRKAGDANEPRRAEIRRTAARLIAEKGVLKATMQGIGRAVRLRGASLYYYFDARESLYAEIMLEHLQGLAHKVCASFDASETLRPRQRLEGWSSPFSAACWRSGTSIA